MNTAGPVLAGLIAAKLIDVEACIPRTADTQFVAALHVTLYGPMRTAETVSNSFAANRIQIVDPLQPNPRFRYLNLHKHFSVDVNALRPPPAVGRLPMRTQGRDAKSQIESLFASLQSPDNLPEVQPGLLALRFAK
ncbi:MAG: hypothetical protein BJ554DRAFT_4011 [Olpidium bornovanus]|uniref:Uncharacterized protein n=1 Tax=Olpidium bornovanus TaxID=278681 RepID=A0A8H8DLG1_9FUNG|nr:MAG: hypothetical protein BJ554DRAFT_4011 [Olpidium bornovanus]